MPVADPIANQPPAHTCRRALFASVALCIMVLAVYGNSLDCSWHFDDDFNIRDNPNVHMRNLSWEAVRNAIFSDRNKPQMPYRPVAGLTFAVNHYLGTLDVFGYHLVNVVIHAVTSVFLFLLLYRILNLPRMRTRYCEGPYFASLLAAALWAVNPLHTQAVTYIVQRMASLAAMFSVIALYAYLRARTSEAGTPRAALFGCTAVATLLAVGSKENAAMIFASLLLLEALILQDDPGRFFQRHWAKMLIVLLFTIGLGALYLYVKTGNMFAFIGSYEARPFTLAQRLLTQPRVLLFYLSLFFYPMPQRMNIAHDFTLSTSLLNPVTTLLSILAIAGLLAASLIFARKHPLWSFPVLFFFLNHLVESSVFPLEIVFEHRNYLPTLFLFLPPSLAVAKLIQAPGIRPSIRWTVAGALVLVLVGLGHSTFMRNFAWKNEWSLWLDASEKAPNQFRVHHNLAKYYQDHGRSEEALAEYEKALTCPVGQRRDEMIVTYYNLGKLSADRGDLEKADFYYQKAIETGPNFVPALTNLAGIYDRLGDAVKAHGLLQQILRINPEDEHANLNLGIYWLKSGDTDKALSHLARTYAKKELRDQALFYLGIAYKLRENFPLAAVTLQKALALGIREIDTHLHLAEVLLRAGLAERARGHVETAVERLSGDDRNMRGTIHRMVDQGPAKALHPSPELILPLMAEVCKEKSSELRQWRDFIEGVLKGQTNAGA